MKSIKVIILLIVLISATYVNAYAFNLGDVYKAAKDFLASGQAMPNTNIDSDLSGLIKGLASAGLAIGTIVAVCSGIVIAINTMANGAYGKAQLKEALTPYIIACIVLFGAWAIWAAFIQIMENTL